MTKTLNQDVHRARAAQLVMTPTFGNGKICYIEMPASDGAAMAQSRLTTRLGKSVGAWVTGRPAASTPGLLIYIMVDSVAETIDSIVAHGGEIAQPIGADAPEITARFRDPGGNVIGLYQQPSE